MPDPNVAIAILLLGFIVLLLLRVPITFSLFLSACLSCLYMKIPLMTMVQRMSKGINSFSLLAIPFFIVAGEIMGVGGISKRLITFSHALVGWLPGGLAQVNCLASMFFGGISGSAVADTSSVGSVLIPMMKDDGYDADFSVGITVTSACQGVLIPPSHNMIMYSICAGSAVSIGKLFLGGLIPGVILGLLLMIICYILAKKRNYPKGKPMTTKERLHSIVLVVPALFTIIIILVGVIGGFFTATESAAIACLYAFFITFFVFREIKLKAMIEILNNSLRTLALVLSLIAAANAFAFMMAFLRVPTMVTDALLSISDNKIIVLLLINVLLLFLGCIMDMAPLILIMTPILLPVVTSMGMDPIQFGVVLILNLAIGLCTPPVGSALFVGCSIGKTKIEKTSKSMLPMFIIMVVTLLLITFVPEIVMTVPNLIK